MKLYRLAGEVRETRLLTGHLLYDPEVTIVAAGLIRAFMAGGTGRQATAAYLRPGNTLGLARGPDVPSGGECAPAGGQAGR